MVGVVLVFNKYATHFISKVKLYLVLIVRFQLSIINYCLLHSYI